MDNQKRYTMDILFTPGTKVKDSNFKEYYPSVNANMDFCTIEPYIKKAVEKYIRPYFGEYYMDIYEALMETGTSDAKMLRLGEFLRYALANYTIYDMVPFVNTVISDMGVRQNSNETSVPIEAWRYKNMRWQALIEADAMMDIALDYIYTHKADFAGYEHKTYSIWIPTTQVLEEYLNISGRRAYMKMSGWLGEGEEEVKCLLGKDQYEDLLDKLEAGTLTDIDNGLIRKIRAYVSDFAMEKAITRLSIMIDGDGLKLLSSTDAFNLRSNAITTFGKDGPSAIRNVLKLDIRSRKNSILNYLSANEAEYPLWKETLMPGITKMVISSDDCVGGISVL